jgi:hypothetical protein
VGIKAQRDEGGGRILLGDNTGFEVVMLRPFRLRVKNLNFNWTLLYIFYCTSPKIGKS